MSEFGEVDTRTVLDKQIIIPINNFRRGVTAPSNQVIGVSPTVPVLRFSKVEELASFFLFMPVDWNRGNVKLELIFALVNNQIDGDTLDMACDYVAVLANAISAGVTKTSTTVNGQTVCTTGGGLAIGDIYTLQFSQPAADVNNPLLNAIGVGFEIRMTDVIKVTAMDLLSACVLYEANY